MPLAPEVRRLVPELFRRVGIPVYRGFSSSKQRALADIVRVGLGDHRAARKQIVVERLKAYPDGGEHLDEFAAEFGFLEDMSGNYVIGRYGQMGDYIEDAARRHRQFNSDRASRALMIYVLIERHGDCLVPLLAQVDAAEDREGFVARVRDTLTTKANAWFESDLPRNAAFREGWRLYEEYLTEWDTPRPRPSRALSGSYGKKAKPLAPKTLDGYWGRTAAYAGDLDLVRGSGASLMLTPAGHTIAQSLQAIGLGPSANRGISPSFEAIHDAFSVDYSRYESNFRPVTHGTLETITGAAVLPGKAPIPWRELPDINSEYSSIVTALNEPLSGSARLDAVRLAMFLYGIGRGVVPTLDDNENGKGELNANAPAQLAAADPHRYALGHARSGRRLWSVAILRR